MAKIAAAVAAAAAAAAAVQRYLIPHHSSRLPSLAAMP